LKQERLQLLTRSWDRCWWLDVDK